jgi:hypothetical protein
MSKTTRNAFLLFFTFFLHQFQRLSHVRVEAQSNRVTSIFKAPNMSADPRALLTEVTLNGKITLPASAEVGLLKDEKCTYMQTKH